MDEVECNCGVAFQGMQELWWHVEEEAIGSNSDSGHGFRRRIGKGYDPPDDD